MARHTAALKIGLALLGLSMAGYILGPPLYWHLTEALAAVSASSCPSCPCECSTYSAVTIPKDCAKHDPEVNEDTEKNYAELLTEELKLREAESLEKHKRADMGLLEAKKVTSSYQKEADKCNSGMETCEEAREKAELALAEQKKLTSRWEERARQKGWREGSTKPNVKSKSNVQVA
ncbi:ESTs gb/T144077 and gb/T43352 come from this gene [Arabidopsis thaliana]|uniref:T7A14.6 protein n=1 Tax=Arabidopsis thaliana TaxID=3702 RepID=Q9ZVP1_ARATH|nr:ESTs gb/T144077 and gb/T43352 come from this gene [Arabidopsis thaliana]